MSTQMTPAFRQYLLKLRGITQKQIAQELGVSQMSVSSEINGTLRSHKVRCAIAEKIGISVNDVFPEYYSKPPARSTSKTDEASC